MREKQEKKDTVAKAIVSTLAASMVQAELITATTKATRAIDDKLPPTRRSSLWHMDMLQ